MREPISISVFTPGRTEPKVLEAITVQRRKLLDDSEERVRESVLTKHKHHLLFVGPRGSGKTHLTTLLANRMMQDNELDKQMHLAWLNEDETCTTPLEFLSRIFRALEKRYPEIYDPNKFEPAYEMKPDAAFNFLQILLKDSLNGHTLVVLVENLDAMFEALGPKGQHALRSMIQENPVFCLVATAQRLVNGLAKRESPFFGFFQTEHLKFLTVHEATELLRKIAEHNKQDEAAEFLATPRGEARVRALHHLSGGNHRVFIVLSQFITRDTIDSLVGPFLKMVDELTPYYQERLRWLPALQRKIMELLCRSPGTVAVKDIAKPLFATNSTIAKQLVELREKGYVESSKRGRESLYEVTEPLMRICIEVKENQSPGPLTLLVDFLRVWYEEGDIKNRLEQCDPKSLSCNYLNSALSRNLEEGNLRKRLLKSSLENELTILGKADAMPRINDLVDDRDELGLAYAEHLKGNKVKALSILDSILGSEKERRITTTARNLKGLILFMEGDDVSALEQITTVLDTENLPSDIVADALYIGGGIFIESDNYEQANTYYKRLIELNEAASGYVAFAYTALGYIAIKNERREDCLNLVKKGLLYTRENNLEISDIGSFSLNRIFNAFFLSLKLPSDISAYFHRFAAVFIDYDSASILGDALIEQLGRYYTSKRKIKHLVESWQQAWEPALDSYEEYEVVLRLLKAGARFLMSDGDESVLLDLVKPEREILYQALGIEGS